jgi:ankyrin repeat protein
MKVLNTRTLGIMGVSILLTGLVCCRARNKPPQASETIHKAAAKGDVAAVRAFLEEGTDGNAKGKDGETPLKLAEDKGYAEMVALLNKHGAK